MNLENVKYDAFISYRHCELDKFVAENLHKQLEAFKIPKTLIKAGKTNGKTKIERVFRDRDELPLASNLADPITQALQSSDYLIVICSPRLLESKWCLKEIETFISMHGRNHVLAVLIEGEPADSFPDILRFDEREITDANGTTHIEKIEVEPLAADVRGKDKAEVLKQIKNELMRLVAPMLDCNYDDLRMRHKEARQKKILRISLAISMVCLVFTAISTTMALTIHKQSNTIEEQYQTALETQAISYASISQTLLEQEDRMAAMAIARMALPDSLEQQADMPYTAAAEFALSDSLAIYNNGGNNFPVKSLEQNSPIRFMKVSPDETTITTVDTNGIITIHDIANASTIASFTAKEKYKTALTDKTNIAYLGSNKLTYIAEYGFCIYDISTKVETFYSLENPALYIATSSDGEYIGVCTTDHFQIFDKNGTSVYSQTFPDSYIGDNAIAFNTEQSLCAFTSTCDTKDTKKGIVSVVNYVTGKEIYSAEMDITYFSDCVFYGNQLIIVGKKTNYSSENFGDYVSDIHIFAYPLDCKIPNWEFVKNDTSFNDLTGTLQWENQTIVISGYNEITFINGKDGTLIHSTSLSSSIVDIAPLVTEGNIIASTERGEKIFVSSDPDSENLIMEEFDTSNGEFSDFYYSTEFVAAHHENSTAINIYQQITSDKTETIATLDDYILSGTYSAKQDAFLVGGYNNQYFFKRQDYETAIALAYDTYAHDMFFTGNNDEQIVLVNTDGLTYYDTITGSLIEKVSITDTFSNLGVFAKEYIASSKDHSILAYYSGPNDSIYLYSVKENTITSIPLQKPSPSSVECIGVNETADKYAIACVEDNTLSVFDKENNLLAETEINAALVTNIIISDISDCVIVSYLDKTVTLYQLSDLSIRKTFTNIRSDMKYLDVITFTANKKNTPTYALYGISECYLLNKDLELVARLYDYLTCNEQEQIFYLTNKNCILSVPYYNYDMLIKEADKQLDNYELSNYQKNQLGI